MIRPLPILRFEFDSAVELNFDEDDHVIQIGCIWIANLNQSSHNVVDTMTLNIGIIDEIRIFFGDHPEIKVEHIVHNTSAVDYDLYTRFSNVSDLIMFKMACSEYL